MARQPDNVVTAHSTFSTTRNKAGDNGNLHDARGRIAVIEDPQAEPKYFETPAKLEDDLQSTERSGSACRVYLMEGVNPDFCALFKKCLHVHQKFFDVHKRSTKPGDLRHDHITPQLPSSRQPSSFSLRYHELREFLHLSEGKLYDRSRAMRDIYVGRVNGKTEEVGVIDRVLSYWRSPRSPWVGELPSISGTWANGKF